MDIGPEFTLPEPSALDGAASRMVPRIEACSQMLSKLLVKSLANPRLRYFVCYDVQEADFVITIYDNDRCLHCLTLWQLEDMT